MEQVREGECRGEGGMYSTKYVEYTYVLMYMYCICTYDTSLAVDYAIECLSPLVFFLGFFFLGGRLAR
jgi:hypothetical protein